MFGDNLFLSAKYSWMDNTGGNTSVLDPYLRVEDEFGDTVALNDDEEYPANLNSMVTFRTQAAGTYYLVATSFEQRKTGRYAIFVQK